MNPILLISILTLFISLNSRAQAFKISNTTQTKYISRSDLVKITLEATGGNGNECCSYKTVHGNIESVSEDSILVRAEILMLSRDFERGGDDFKYDWNWKSRLNTIAKSDISYLYRHKSRKSEKLRSSLTVAGGLLLFTGIGTALNSVLVSGQKNKRNLLLAGGLQFGTGIIVALSTNPKKYEFKNTDNPWRFE